MVKILYYFLFIWITMIRLNFDLEVSMYPQVADWQRHGSIKAMGVKSGLSFLLCWDRKTFHFQHHGSLHEDRLWSSHFRHRRNDYRYLLFSSLLFSSLPFRFLQSLHKPPTPTADHDVFPLRFLLLLLLQYTLSLDPHFTILSNCKTKIPSETPEASKYTLSGSFFFYLPALP